MATLNRITAAFSTARPRVERTRFTRGNTATVPDHTARTHDYNLFKSLMDSLTDLSHSHLLGIISNRKRVVSSHPGASAVTERTRPQPQCTHMQLTSMRQPLIHTGPERSEFRRAQT